MRYGTPYKGSKNAIAPWVVERLFVQERFADEYRDRVESGTTAPLFDTEED